MQRIIYLLTFSILIYGCKPQLELSTIDGFPEDIDGCSCYFSKSKDDFEKNKFIYLDNYYSGIATFSLNGELIKINLDNPDKNDYEVEIEFLTDEKTSLEVWWKTGILRVKTKSGRIIESEFVGECGC